MNKLLVSIFIPVIDLKYDFLVPNCVRVGTLKNCVLNYIKNFLNDDFLSLRLIDRESGLEYDSNSIIKDTTIINGSILVLI